MSAKDEKRMATTEDGTDCDGHENEKVGMV